MDGAYCFLDLRFCAIFFLIATFLWIGYVIYFNVPGPSVPYEAVLPYGAVLADLFFRLNILAAALGAGYICARLFEGLPWRSLGLTRHTGWLRDLLLGCVIGFVALAVAVGIATVAGGLRFSLGGSVLGMIRSLGGSAVLLFVAALAEEALFRGYPLQTLTRARLALLALILTSVPFGMAHLSNPNVIPVATFANTALAGIWLGVAYLRTRSLWFPLGVHWAWNWALGGVFGLPISGKNSHFPSTAKRRRCRSRVADGRRVWHRRRRRLHDCARDFHAFYLAYEVVVGNAGTAKAHLRREPCVT